MELTVIAIKREDGLYHFDHPHNDTVEELLMNGTEEAIDEHCYFKTGLFPVAGDEVEISLFLEEPTDYDTLMSKTKDGSLAEILQGYDEKPADKSVVVAMKKDPLKLSNIVEMHESASSNLDEEALENVTASSDALVFSETVPLPASPKVAVSSTLRAPSKPGVPPGTSQLSKLDHSPLPLFVQTPCPE